MKSNFDKINTTRLKQMVKSDELVLESLKLLLKNITKDLEKVKKHLEKKEFQKIAELCHKMKLSTHIMSLDHIELEMNELGKKDITLSEKKFIAYTQKMILEIEKVIK